MTRALAADPRRRPDADPPVWFTVDERAPAHARRHVGRVLTAYEVTDGVCDDAVLLVSELVTNVFRHTLSDEVGVSVRVTRERIGVEVHESEPGDPAAAARILAGSARTAAGDATTGRGLQIVDARASGWGVRHTDRTSTVWFTLDAS